MGTYRRRLPAPNVWALTACAAAALYVVALSEASISRHHEFISAGYDLGIFEQAVWLLSHGHAPFSTVRGRNLFADHFQPSLALYAPLARLSLPDALLVTQATLLAAASPLLYVLARRRRATRPLSLAVALLWLASPLTQWANLFDFHPETAVPVLLVLGAILLERRQVGLFLLTAIVACGLKEDVPLVYAAWGVVLALKGRRTLGAALSAAAVAWFALALTVAIPAFGGSLSFYSKRFAGTRGSTVTSVLVGLVEHPVRALETAATTSNAEIIVALVLCSGGISLLAPRMLLLAVPPVVANILSAYSYQHDLHFQYQLIPAAGCTIAAAYGAGVLTVRRGSSRLVPAAALVLIAGAVAVTAAVSPAVRQLRRHEPAFAADDRRALALIPPHASVAATPDLVAHLATRTDIYQLPEPFDPHPDNGEYWSNGDLRARAATVRWVIYDAVPLDPYPEQQLRQLEARLPHLGFRLVFARDGVRVLRRSTAP